MDPKQRRLQDEIRLDENGNWYQGDFPILHDRTVTFLHKNINLDENGRYYLTGEDQPVYFKVEDVPYLIAKLKKLLLGY